MRLARRETGLSPGVTLISSCIRRLESFLGFKILNFNIFWGFQKNKEFFGYGNYVENLLGSSENWTIFRGNFFAI